MPGQRVSRSELYDLVWSVSASQLAKRFSISDVMLGKICIAANIPKPERGYWAKREAGKATKKTPLPSRSFGQDEFVPLKHERMTMGEDEERMLTDPIPPAPIFDEHIDAVVIRAQLLAARAPIKKSLVGPHPEIKRILRKDDKRRAKQDGSLLSAMLYKTVSDSKQGRRRLIILNALLHALTYCGARFAKTTGEAEDWSVFIGSICINFQLRQKNKRPEREANRRGHAEEDESLSLSITWWQSDREAKLEWTDTESAKLENQINDMVVGFLVLGERIYRDQEIWQHNKYVQKKAEIEDARRRRQEAVAQQELDRQKKQIEDRRKNLFAEVASFRMASEIRTYVDARLSIAEGEISTAQKVELQQWADWALTEADRIDPLKNKDHDE